jgi:Lamin Tail Domain
VAGGAQVQVLARAIDLAGNVGESSAVELPWAEAPVPIAITELHANPLGPEPAQEFVELENVGPEPLDLGGLALEDEKGMDLLPAAVIAPGERVLVVPAGFDPASEKDTPPAPGTQLVRVDTRLGFDGLSNSGERVQLRGRDGGLVSSYSVATAVSGAAWAGKSVHRVPESGCDQSASWTQHPLPATPGWGPP